MRNINKKSGFTFVEIMFVAALTTIIITAGTVLYISGQAAYSLASVRADLQENARRTLQRISIELTGSGRDSNGNIKVSFVDGGGANGTDLLRFSVPICVCGMSAKDTNGNISRWGAPMTWGDAGCSTNYPLNGGNQVDICHNSIQDMSVVKDAVKGHLAHGDYLGSCNSCNINSYTNRTVEYQKDSSGQLLRRVLDSTNGYAVVNSVVVAQGLTDFQVNINANLVTVAVSLTGQASGNRTIVFSNSMNVILRNY